MASCSTVLILFLALVATPCLAWSPYHDAHMKDNRTVIVQLFEWRWDDIATECENFLGPHGYGGVQLPAAAEHFEIVAPWFNPNVTRPWYERYQPISYNLVSRSGDRAALADMISRCNKAGVRVYADAVINHMSGSIGAGHGIGGSFFDSGKYDYPAVPYSKEHFNSREKCNSSNGGIDDFDDPWQSRVCELVGLHDLDQGLEPVRKAIKDHMDELIDMGVAGFRVDATKHMFPEDLEVIFSRLKNLSTEFFEPNLRPFMLHECSESNRGEGKIQVEEYFDVGRILEFRYVGRLQNSLHKLEGYTLSDLWSVGREGEKLMPEDTAIAFLDNHDIQRGHNGDFKKVITFREGGKLLKMGTAFFLAWNYGLPKIMSSYDWPALMKDEEDTNDWIGPPSNADWSIKRVQVLDKHTCDDGWVCEHRWREIMNMVEFRNVVGDAKVVNWWANTVYGSGNQIAFERKSRGFIAMNNDDEPMTERLFTGLPSGTYCDIITGNKDGDKCTGKTIYVGPAGEIDVFIRPNAEVPIMAIHVNSKLSADYNF